MRHELSEEEVAFYKKNGFLHVPGMYSREEGLRVGDDLFAFLKEAEKTGYDHPDFFWGADRETGRRMPIRLDNVEDKTPSIQSMLGHPGLFNGVTRMIGGPFIQARGGAILKPAGVNGCIPGHRDRFHQYYRRSDEYSSNLNVGVHVREVSGPSAVWYLPGSHRWEDQDPRVKASLGKFAVPEEAVVYVSKPGDVTFHDIRCIHGNTDAPNTHDNASIFFEFRCLETEREKGPHNAEYLENKLKAYNWFLRQRSAGIKMLGYPDEPVLDALPAWLGGEMKEPPPKVRLPHAQYLLRDSDRLPTDLR